MQTYAGRKWREVGSLPDPPNVTSLVLVVLGRWTAGIPILSMLASVATAPDAFSRLLKGTVSRGDGMN